MLNDRPSGGSMSRFRIEHGSGPRTTREEASLLPGHPALTEARTVFTTRVFDVGRGNLLVSGHSNAKIGKHVIKGPWSGMPIYTLTLEERATCPPSCDLWAACYGNSMPAAMRRRYTPEMVEALGAELLAKAHEHRRTGFVVRLHVLGDFPDAVYVDRWGAWLAGIPGLRIFGYTAHPETSDIGRAIGRMNVIFSGRSAIRYSVAPDDAPRAMQATTIWRDARGEIDEGLVCPQSSGDTLACGACGLCWSESAASKRIVFIGHGRRKRGPAVVAATKSTPKASLPAVVALRPHQGASTASDVAAALDAEETRLERLLAAVRALRAMYR